MTVRDIYEYLDEIAPFSDAASWDNSGLIVGSMDAYVEKIVICLDVNNAVIDFAVKENAQLIVSHHPVIFKSLSRFDDNCLAYTAAVNKINIISAHTNLDKSPGGVNDTLCETIGAPYIKASPDICCGFLNIIETENEMTAADLVLLLKQRLNTHVSYCDTGKKFNRIGVCCGSGADFVSEAFSIGCNAFITGEASYHDFLDAKNSGVSLFACGHFETEAPVIDKLRKFLSGRFNSLTILDYVEKNSVITES